MGALQLAGVVALVVVLAKPARFVALFLFLVAGGVLEFVDLSIDRALYHRAARRYARKLEEIGS